jgi:hypothetical protein
MKIIKLITTSIDIDDAIDFCITENAALIRLRAIYENKCWQNSFITKVLTVKQVSDCMVGACHSASEGHINVVFEAQTIQLFPGEVISACVIIKPQSKIKENMSGIICKNNFCDANIEYNSKLDSLKASQIISVIVKKAECRTGLNTIQVIGSIFLPDKKYELFHVITAIAPLDIAKEYRDLYEEIIDQEERMKVLKKEFPERWKKFEELLHAHNGKPKLLAGQVNIFDTFKAGIKAGSWLSRSREMNCLLPEMQVLHAKETDVNAIICAGRETAEIIVLDILRDYLAYIELICEMVEIYKEEYISSHENLWMAFNSVK